MAKTIIHDAQGNTKWGGEDHLEVAQTKSFASLIFELLSEKVPSDAELKVFELILNLSIDHGPDTPSAIKVIESAKSGKTISESLADGIMEINDTHGGAGEPLMELLYKVKSEKLNIKSVVEDYLREGKRLPGLGHRLYKGDDLRAILLFEKVKELGINPEFIDLLKEIQDELETQKGIRLPINIDGAIGAILCSFGWESNLGKAVFIIARIPGLCGHFLNNSPKI